MLAENLITVLKEKNFFSAESNLKQIVEIGKKMSALAGNFTKEAKFEALPSLIPAQDANTQHEYALLIDIGGTSTKVGIRQVLSPGREHWRLLFELKNIELKEYEYSGNKFHAFCSLLAKRIRIYLDQAGFPREKLQACGIVWSNAIENKFYIKPKNLSSEIAATEKCITGIVVQREFYGKGEWFIEDLKNGDDLGEIFEKSFADQGLNFISFLITNDTPLTMKSLTTADSGMVASTGLNGTLLKPLSDFVSGSASEKVICNAEMGGRFVLDDRFFSLADFAGAQKKATTVEQITAGRFLPFVFVSHVIELGNDKLDNLKELAKHLTELGEKRFFEFRARDLSLLLFDQVFFVARRTKKEYYSAEVLEILRELALQLILRSAKLCAVVALATISNQIEEKDDFLIALDSRLAREIPIFLETMEKTLKEITPAGKKINLNLVEPLAISNGKISVPMLGAARALDSLI